MSEKLLIDNKHLAPKDLFHAIEGSVEIELSQGARKKVVECREYLEQKLAQSDVLFYGINTGFGALHNVRIPQKSIEALQENLVRSHTTGLGGKVPDPIVRLMLILKIIALAKGHSGITVETLDLLIALVNHDILPIVYKQGSLGASGDLAPLAHMSLCLLGEGDVMYQGQRMTASSAFEKCGLKPVTLKSKEGIALLNGTQFMLGYGIWLIWKAERLSEQADMIGAMSADAFSAKIDPFDEAIHWVRPHAGQSESASRVRDYLKDSELLNAPKSHTQDPYSMRCIPQVHGASRDTISHVKQVMEIEINSVTDNPIIFPKKDKILSGGNFHGQPLAIALDMLAIALSELGSISERRTFLLQSGQRQLPYFLANATGVNSGLMITQYSAAAIASQNKQYCTPASADSITSSNGQEDHVSMGANAATKAFDVALNTEKILAIELLNATQALDFRPLKSSPFLEDLKAQFREYVSFNEQDRILYNDIQRSVDFLQAMKF